MDASWMLTSDAQDADQMQQSSPPILECLDFGADYDFEGGPHYPSWFHSSNSAVGFEASNEPTQATGSQLLPNPEPQPLETFLSSSRKSLVSAQKDKSLSAAQGKIKCLESNVQAKTDRDLVRIAPKPLLPKRERSPSPSLAHAMMATGCYNFPMNNATVSDRDDSKRQKRAPYAKKTCLRCQMLGKKCSGGFPCEGCLGLWSRRSAQAKGLAWRACFDSNLQELNFLQTRIEILSRLVVVMRTLSQLMKQPPNAKRDGLLPPRVVTVTEAIQEIWRAAQSAAREDDLDIPQHPKDQAAPKICRQTTCGQGNQYSRQPKPASDYATPSPPLPTSTALAVAVFHIQESLVVQVTGLSGEELLEEKHKLVMDFFDDVGSLIVKFKSKTSTTTSFEREYLIECLCTIRLLVKYSPISFSLLNGDLKRLSTKLCLARATLLDQTQKWEVCLAQQSHLTMYCEHWLRKLAGEQWPGELEAMDSLFRVIDRPDLVWNLLAYQNSADERARCLPGLSTTSMLDTLAARRLRVDINSENDSYPDSFTWADRALAFTRCCVFHQRLPYDIYPSYKAWACDEGTGFKTWA